MQLTPALASQFARIALGHVTKEFPHKLDHVLNGPEDGLRPRDLHPVFHGSFDWHSCVHSYWMLLTLGRRFPDLPEAADIAVLADRMLSEDKLAGELAYLNREYSGGFERPYGWAWLLALHGEAVRHGDRHWGAALEPLARAFAERLRTYLAILTYPIRTGTHYNTAFALVLARDWAIEYDPTLAKLIAERAEAYYGEDRDCPAWEPGGDEFLSSALIEALAMKETAPDSFAGWFQRFLPQIRNRQPASLFTPAIPSDRSDGKIAHLDGFNLSRAWCWRAIAPALDPQLAAIAEEAAEVHLAASLPHVEGDYMGEHWLASFALLALTAGNDGA